MHKLVLCSGGIFFENGSDPILDHIFSLIDDAHGKKMVYLPTAHRDDPGDEAVVNDYCRRHGFSASRSLYLTDPNLTDEEIHRAIAGAGVIYASGGNLQFLLDTWRARGVDRYLREAYDSGTVVAGESSGGMCWCRRGYDDCGPDGQFIFLDALDFVPCVMCPHWEDWPEFLTDVKKQDLDGLGIDNDIAVSVVDGTATVIDSGRNPRHSAWYLPAAENWAVHDIVKEHIVLKNFQS